jgi:hypothetical protein
MSSLKNANDALDSAATRLHDAMRKIAELRNPSLSPTLQRLGAAQVEIFETQYRIWALEPDLLPKLLRCPAESPEAAYDVTLRRVREAEVSGALEVAIGVLDIFLKYQTSPRHLELARVERARLANASNA